MPWFRLFRIGLYVVAALPLLYVLLDGVIALEVYMRYGHWPYYGFRRDLEDERLSILRDVWEHVGFSVLLGPCLWLLPLAGLSLIGWQRFKQTQPPYRPPWVRSLAPTGLAVVVWMGCWMYAFVDPFDVMNWIAD